MATAADLPVAIRPICTSLGIKIIRRASVPPGKAYLAWGSDNKDQPLVLLPSNGDLAWDRFCAAHELAHFVLIKELGTSPKTQKEYWQVEALCDEFARDLLLPIPLVSATAPSAPETLDGFFDVCTQLAQRARVPWLQAAKRVQNVNPQVAYLRINKNQVGDYVINASSFSNDAGRFTKIKRNSLGWTTLENELAEAHSRRSSHRRDLDLGRFANSSFEKFARKVGLTRAIVEPSARADVLKVVGLVDPAAL